MRTTADFPITVTATDWDNLERRLNEAEAVARTRAMQEGRQGILVTRHGYNSFTVALSDAVPFGLTYEHRTAPVEATGPTLAR
jgi:hypothetical protein